MTLSVYKKIASLWIFITIAVLNCELALGNPSSALKKTEAPLELQSFAHALVAFNSAGETDYFIGKMDFDYISNKAKNALNKSIGGTMDYVQKNLVINSFLTPFEKGIRHSLVQTLKMSEDWQFLHYRKSRKQHFLTLSAETEESIELIELLVEKDQSDQWKVLDWYRYSTDTWASDLVQSFAYLMKDKKSDQDLIETSRLVVDLRSKDPNKLLSAFNNLDNDAKSNLGIQRLVINTISQWDVNAFTGAFIKVSPFLDKKDFLYIKFVYHRLNKEPKTALTYLDAVIDKAGGSLYLKAVKAEILLELQDTDGFIDTLTSIIENSDEKVSFTVHSSVLLLMTEAGWYRPAVDFLDVWITDWQIAVDMDILMAIPEFEPLKNSPEYAAWLAKKA